MAPDRPAGFWIRLVALSLDSLPVIGMLLGVVLVVGLIGLAVGLEQSTLLGAVVIAYYVAGLPITLGYHVLLESSPAQATWGKRVMGLYVQRTDGTRLSRGRSTGRFFARALSGVVLGIGYLMVGFTDRKRALHDYVADTLVLRRGDRRPAGWAIALFVCLCVMPGLIGIVAAVAVPGLMRARMSGNEAAAIGSLRAINSAEATYAVTCGVGGYAGTLAALAVPPQGGVPFISDDLVGGTKSGYRIVLTPGTGSQDVSSADRTCNGAASVTGYHAVAIPITVGTTGQRSFATNESGQIYVNSTGDAIGDPIPPGTMTID